MSEAKGRPALEGAYRRLRQTLEDKDVNAERLKAAALEALDRARVGVEHDPSLVSPITDHPNASDDDSGAIGAGGPTAISEPDPKDES